MIRHLWIAAAAIGPCTAALLVEESFAYTDGAVLTGQNGGTGWAGAWTQSGESCVIHHDGIGYTDGIGNQLTTAGGNIDTAGTATTRSFRSVSPAPVTDVWISFLFNLTASNTEFEGVGFYNGDMGLFGVSNSSIDTGPEIALNKFVSGASLTTTSEGAFGQTYFIVLHLAEGAGPGGNDLVDLFINPALTGTPTSPIASINAPDLDFDRIRLAGANGASLLVDEIRIGHGFEDVSPHVPAQGDDSDGDGLTDAQEIVLGLDPNVSDASLITAIRSHPDFFGLYDHAGILGLTRGGVIYEGSGGSADITFEIQQSSTLATWPDVETVRRSVPLDPGKNYVRLSLEGDRP